MKNRLIKVRSIDTGRKPTDRGYTYSYIRIQYDHPLVPLNASKHANSQTQEGRLMRGLVEGGIYEIGFTTGYNGERWRRARQVLPAGAHLRDPEHWKAVREAWLGRDQWL